MSHQLPNLPYAYDALEPFIDEQTMHFHHDKHHATYVSNLNVALEGYPQLQDQPAETLLQNLNDIPETIRTAIRNNGGGHANHTLFWQIMDPKGTGKPVGALGEALNRTFRSFDNFKETFAKAATTRFGSGWAWLVANKQGDLSVTSTANQDSPLSEGYIPLLTLDVWEHAYYLKYQNRRVDYIASWWNVVNWNKVNELYLAAGR